MNDSDRDDLVFLYFADALDGAERDEVEAWLAAGGPDVRAAVARAESELALLAATRPVVAAPAAVRDRLLTRAARRGASGGLHARGRRLALAAGLAGLLIGGAIGLAAYRSARDDAESLQNALSASASELAEAREAQAATDEEIAELEARMRSLESDLVLARKAIDVLQADEAESLALTGTGGSPARGRVFWDWDEWYCYLHVTGLEPRSETVYALWLFTEDGVVPVGTFSADAAGEAVFLGPVPHDVGHVLRAGVSIEPDADIGSQPRGELMMVGDVDPARG